MKLRIQQIITPIATTFIFLFLIIGCSLNDSEINNNANDQLTQEELQVAGQIIAESLSDDKDGIFSSLNDAFTLPSPNRFVQSLTTTNSNISPVFKFASVNKGNTEESNYSYTYDPSTGKHLVSFIRSVNQENISQESAAELEYIYYDNNNNFITSPRLENELIETIDYVGLRSGSIETTTQNSSYERNDQFVIQGLSGNALILKIDGIHEGSGQFKSTRSNGTVIERSYNLTVEFLNVEINNQTVEENGSLNKGVTGALAYEMYISKTINSDESMKTINGTIEFNGDGTALLRFRNLLKEFKIKLETGTLLESNEFEGFINSANSVENSFTLFNGETYLLSSESEISLTGDLVTLGEVEALLDNDIRVEAKGLFVTDEADSKIVQSVEFNFEQEDIEFDHNIVSVQADIGVITLENDIVLQITEETDIDDESHLFNLNDIAIALENGNSVNAEGEFQPQTDGTNTVLNIEFKYEDQDFDDFVTTADIDNQSFSLNDGSEYIVNSDTQFKDDISSIEDLVILLQEGYKVEAEGVYFIDSDGLSTVLEVEFKIEDFEDSKIIGVVKSVNISEQSFSLVNGLSFQVDSRTKFENKYRDLNELAEALETENAVKVEIKYFIDSNDNNIALELDFETERDDDDEDGDDIEEGEFEGEVQTTNLNQQTFVLKNGLLLDVNSDTEFSGDAIESLEELSDILQAGHTVHAEGDYFTNDTGRNIVTQVEFEVEEEDFEEKEFSGEAHRVNLNQRFFIVENGLVLHVDFNTEFTGSEIESLEELNDALEAGHTVEAEGEYFTNNTGRNIATVVSFEIIEEEFEEKEFEGEVQTVNLSQEFFILNGGLRLVVDSETEFNGDISSLQDLSTSLNAGNKIVAVGDYFTNNTGQNIVTQVTFEVEEGQGDNGGNGGGNNGDNGNENGDDDDGDDEGDDDGEDGDEDGEDDGDDEGNGNQFQGDVQSVNLNQNFFILKGGQQYYVNSDTNIQGDYDSLEAVKEALESGTSISASGTFTTNNTNRKIVTEVTFENSN